MSNSYRYCLSKIVPNNRVLFYLRNEIYNHCVKNLAKYSLPYEIEFINELPRTKVNKVDYRKR